MGILAGCASPPENTNILGAPSGNVSAVPNPASEPASATAPKPVKAAPAKMAPSHTPAAKSAAAKIVADPAYKVVGPYTDGYTPELEKVRVSPPPKNLVVPANAHVVLKTSKGDVTIELNTGEAPLHTKSFYYLARKGFFDGTVFHRYADLLQGAPGGKTGFIIQGGDPFTRSAATSSMAGGGGPGYQIPREHNHLTHQKLVIAAARTADPNSAGSQFYITQDAVPFLDEGDGYTVFGKIVKGADHALALRKGDVIHKAVVE
jgi:cyclophilin family peptidyl-prolyl cis-trans isomerase